MGLSKGARLGPYEIISPLGAGGMGEVYRARDTRLERDVAIKLVSTHSEDAGRQQRLQMEARAISQLQHPHICALYDIGTYQEETFLVMELLEGETLDQKLSRGTMPVGDLATMAIDLASALEYAHAKGIIHRDIKPGNIFITNHSGAKLMDFGLVKRSQIVPSLDAVTAGTTAFDPRLTSPGAALGTVAYMSPEQARGEEVDQRSDLFSFGAVLYEASTGRLPFPGGTTAIIFDAILNRPPIAPVTLKPSLPPALSDIVNKLLDKDKELRYQSASELRTDLKRLRRELEVASSGKVSPSTAVPVQSRFQKKWAFLALTLLVVGLAIWLVKMRSMTATNEGGQLLLDVRGLTNTGHAPVAAASPDGRYVAYVNRENGKSELRLLQTSTGRDVVILPGVPEVMGALHFSPDGEYIYFLRDLTIKTNLAGVFRVATLGGPAAPIATDADWFALTISPDGKQLAYVSNTNKEKGERQIILVQNNGSNRRTLSTFREPVWFLEWSPRGDSIAAVTFTDTDMILVTVSVTDGSVHDFNSHSWGSIGQPVWTSDGETIFVPGVALGGSTMQIWAVDHVSGSRHPITSGTSEYNQITLSITGAGDLVAGTRNFDSAIWITDANGAHARRIGSATGEGSDSVAWVGDKAVGSNMITLTVRDVNNGGLNQLSSYSRIHRQLARCGPSHVAFWGNDEKHHDHIAQIDLNTGIAAPVTDGIIDDKPSCTSDGSVVVFQYCEPQTNKCFIARKSIDSPEITRLVPLNPSDGAYPVVSPDNSKILFQREPGAKDDSYSWLGIVPIDGGAAKFIRMPIPIGDANAVRWSPNGQALLYLWMHNGVGNIWSMPLAGGQAKQVTQFDSDYIFAFDVAPDGRLAISRGKRVQDIVLIKNAR